MSDGRLPEVSILIKGGGPLTKRIALLKDGASFRADGSDCRMWGGTARRQPIADVHALAATIDRLESNQALALGRLRGDLPDEVSITTKSQLGRGDTNAIARSIENFEFASGVPAYALLDFDEKGMPDEVRQNIEALGGVWEALCAVLPALERTAHVTRRSTSSGLYRTDTGERLRGSGGMHIYVLVADGADIERFLRNLHERCWLAGLGWHMIGAGGKLLERSIVDRMVGSPERLVFEGKPVLKAPLEQDAEHRRPVAVDGTALDTATSCPALSEAEVSRLRELRADSIRRLAPEADRARKEFVALKAEEIATRTGKAIAEARRIADAWAGGNLLPDVVLPFDRQEFSGATVADVIANPQRFGRATLSDPVEGEGYGRGKALLVSRGDGAVWIQSFAHGGARYTLEGERVNAEDEFTDVFSSVVARLPSHLARQLYGLPDAVPSPSTQPDDDAAAKAAFWIDMRAWIGQPIPERLWDVDDRVPRQTVGNLSGEGGVGKSILELTRNVAHTLGTQWLGARCRQGPTFYLGAEDSEDELHIRIAAICEHFMVSFDELVAGGMYIKSLLGQDACLCEQNRNGKVITTKHYALLREMAGDLKPVNISLDPLTRVYPGDEISRACAYQFVAHMQAVANVSGGSVTVLSHPSLTGISSGSGTSGSTGWHGAYRFRQYLTTVKTSSGKESDPDLRELQIKKVQYGRQGERLLLRYQRGVFVPVTDDSPEVIQKSAEAEEEFMTLLRRLKEAGRNVSHHSTSPNFAPRVFADEPDAFVSKDAFEAAMLRLFKSGRIRVEVYGKPSRTFERIVANEQQ